MADAPATPDRYDEAIRHFRKRVPITDPAFRALEQAERDQAFWVAGVTQARPLQEIFDAIDQAIVDGTTLEDFKAKAGEQLAEAWGGENAPRLETVFRTNVMTAYNGGRHDIMSDPVVKEARPYWRFDDTEDDRECEICAPLHGHIAAADDPWWRTHHPPLHHQCRCQPTPLSAEEAEAEGIPTSHPKAEPPDEGFGRPPAPAAAEPSLDAFDPDIKRILRERFE